MNKVNPALYNNADKQDASEHESYLKAFIERI